MAEWKGTGPREIDEAMGQALRRLVVHSRVGRSPYHPKRPKSQTLNFTTHALNPKPYTLNPNPKPLGEQYVLGQDHLEPKAS